MVPTKKEKDMNKFEPISEEYFPEISQKKKDNLSALV
jgi:hypothetical protein